MVTLCADVDVMHDPGNVADAHARRREAALAGHTGNAAAVRQALGDPDAGVRATALEKDGGAGLRQWNGPARWDIPRFYGSRMSSFRFLQDADARLVLQ